MPRICPAGGARDMYVACLWTVIMAAVLAACDVPDEEVPVAGEATPGEATPGEATPGEALDASSPGERAQTMPSDSIAARFLAETRFVNADFERGELLSYACIVCHSLGPGEGHLIGPNLNGIFGRPAASSQDFPYSDALREARYRLTRLLRNWTPGLPVPTISCRETSWCSPESTPFPTVPTCWPTCCAKPPSKRPRPRNRLHLQAPFSLNYIGRPGKRAT